MHFGLGGRQCIGKTIALTNIYKIMSTLLSEFTFELAEENNSKPVEGSLPELISVSISDLKHPLFIKAHTRT